MNTTTLKISHVNGVQSLSLSLDDCGVYVARGRNGAGKTSAIEAIKAASGDANARAEVTDGQPRGSVEQSGRVLLSVGGRTKRGELPNVHLVSTSPLSRLIDPGIKDPDAANKARIKALLELRPLPATDKHVIALAGDSDELLAHIDDAGADLLTAAENVRKKALELALEADKEGQFHEGEVQAISSQMAALGKIDGGAVPAAEASAALAACIKAEERARIEWDARKRMEEAQAKIRASLGTRPDATATEASLAALQLEAETMRDQIAVLQSSLRLQTERIEATKQAVASLKNEALRWDEQNKVLSATISGATAAEVELAKIAVSQAQDELKLAQDAEAWKKLKASADTALKYEAEAKRRSQEFRQIAEKIPAQLKAILADESIGGLTLVNGRLAADIDGRICDFQDRLSFGQRVRIALNIALQSAAEHGVVKPVIALDPEFWTALDPERKAEIASEASLLGIYVITEEPTEGELRFERI